MTYIKHNWDNGELITSEKLNNMETGIAAAAVQRNSDSKYANALIGTGSGTARLTMDDAWEAPLINLDITGKSEQVVTTGAQLFDAAAHTFTAGKCVGFNDGVITPSDNYKCIEEYIPFTGYGQKSLTLNHRPGAGYAYAGMAFYDEDKKFISGGKGAAIWVREETAYMRFTVDESVEPETIMINTGNTSLPWEPYTGGKPSPSPEYPQPIISTGSVGTGAQLFDAGKIPSLSQGGATVANNGDGSFTISGNGILTEKFSNLLVLTGTEARDLIGVPTMISIDAITKTLPFYVITISGAGEKVELNNSGYTMPVTVAANMIAAEDYTIQFGFFGASSKDIIPGTIKPMINAGDTAKPWEPYTGGRPSPSPEYPQPLDVTVKGAQLLDFEQCLIDWNAGYTKIGNCYDVITTGTGFSKPISFSEKDIQVTLSGEILDVEGSGYRIDLLDTAGNLVGSMRQNTSSVTALASAIRLNYSTAGKGRYTEIMLNTGNTALPCQPYQSKTATITLTEPLRGIGDVRDRITCRDGAWGIERNVGVINNQQWVENNVRTNTLGNRFKITINDAIKKNNYPIICSKYKYVNGTNMEGFSSFGTEGDYITTDEGNDHLINVRVLNPNFTTIETFKEFMADAVTICPFATPAFEPFAAATQSALNTLTTYQGRTTVTITAGGPDPDVGLEYVQDTRAVIADLQAQIDEIRNGGTNE